MKKEDFVALGISEDLAEKAAEAVGKEYKDYVPRTRLNEEIQKKKNAEESYSTVKAELDKLKESAGDNETLKAQIETLKNDLKNRETTHKAEIDDMKMTNAIQASIAGKVKDTAIVASLLDKSKLILSEDGKLTGIEDQIKELKEAKPFLFMEGETYPDVKDGGEPGGQGGSNSTRASFANWMDDIMGGN